MKISSESSVYGVFLIIDDFWLKFLSRCWTFRQCETSFISGTEDITFWKDFLAFCKKKPPPPKNYHKLELNEPIVCFQNITPSKLPLSPHPKKIQSLEYQVLYFSHLWGVNCTVEIPILQQGKISMIDWYLLSQTSIIIYSHRAGAKNHFKYSV